MPVHLRLKKSLLGKTNYHSGINVFIKPIAKHTYIRNKYTEFLAKKIWTAPQICVILIVGS